MATPYVTPSVLTSAPTGVSWSIIPMPKATTSQQFAEQTNICHRATSMIDGFVNQTMRATIDTEVRSGPGDFRINIEQATGNVRWILSRWPVTAILAIQVSGNAMFPRQWTQVQSGFWDIENPVIGVYGSYTPGGSAGTGGQSILIAPGYGSWWLGRNGYRFSCTYLNGWPHAGIMTNATAGSSTIQVDDVTGFAGATARIYDGADTETVHITSVTATTMETLPNGGGTAPAGPGTLNLAAPLTFSHAGSDPATVVVSSLPSDVLWAATLAATAQALEAGITSVSIQNITGSQTAGGHGVSDMHLQWETIMEPYRRSI
jgi:hypothetical protein